MSHPFETLVLGGVDVLKILRVSQNFVTNKYFTANTSGWTESQAGILTRLSEINAFGEFMGKIAYASDLEYAAWNESQSNSIGNRTFLASWRAKSEASLLFKAEFFSAISGEIFGTTIFDVSPDPKKYVLTAGTTITTATPHSIEFRIYGTDEIGNADLRFDSVYFGEVFEEFEFVQPKVVGGESSFLTFDKLTFGKNELWDGEIQEFNKKWRPNYFARWDVMGRIDEAFRQRIASLPDLIFCIPHKDANWGFLCQWDRNFQRRYAFGRFIAHKSVIALRGVELVKEFPDEVVGVTYGMEQSLFG